MNEFEDKLNEIQDNLEKYIEIEKMFGNDTFFSSVEFQQKQSEAIVDESEKAKRLEKIALEIKNCNKCDLYKRRKNSVAGEGNANADLVFIGEAPGREEDMQGKPFVGRAGKLLTKIIAAMKLTRNEVFIGNIIKCRPPNNRNPYPYEIKACEDFLIRQLEIIQPKVICTLGKFATQSLLNIETPISRIRGKFQDYRGIPVMPTYHPAYLLRNPSGKKPVWEDMKKIMKELKMHE